MAEMERRSEPGAELETSLEDQRTYARVGNTLRVGLWASIAVMVLGMLLTALAGKSQPREVLPLNHLVSAIGAGNPRALLDVGILLLFATPLAGVLTALAQFVTSRDRAFTIIGVALLVILVAGFLIALH
jgi:uncharacterized membrane protein